MNPKQKYPRAEALKVARHICLKLADSCMRLICAGSLRRRKEMVGDVEILYIPELEVVPDGLFDTKRVNKVDTILDQFLAEGILAKRKNSNGSEMWGEKNKFAVHVATGIPVDFFAATEENWFNYLVCRTGGAENNKQIALAAKNRGWTWNPYGSGFSCLGRDDKFTVLSERDVFDFVGLQYKEPRERL